jgi:hypothetical protein
MATDPGLDFNRRLALFQTERAQGFAAKTGPIPIEIELGPPGAGRILHATDRLTVAELDRAGGVMSLKVDGRPIDLQQGYSSCNSFTIAGALLHAGYHVNWDVQRCRVTRGRRLYEGQPMAIAFSLSRFTPLELSVQNIDHLPFRQEFALYEMSTGKRPKPASYKDFEFNYPEPQDYQRWQAWKRVRLEMLTDGIPQDTWAGAVHGMGRIRVSSRIEREEYEAYYAAVRLLESGLANANARAAAEPQHAPDSSWTAFSNPRSTSSPGAPPVVESVKAAPADAIPERRVQLSVIFVRSANASDKAAAKKRLMEAKTQIQVFNMSFADLARELSQDALTKAHGGDLALLSEGELTTRYGSVAADRLLRMDVGQLKVIEVPGGYALFSKTDDVEPPS